MNHSFCHPTPTNHKVYCLPLTSRQPQYNDHLHLTPCSFITINEEDNDSDISINDCNNNNITQQKITKVSISTNFVTFGTIFRCHFCCFFPFLFSQTPSSRCSSVFCRLYITSFVNNLYINNSFVLQTISTYIFKINLSRALTVLFTCN